MVRSYCHRPSIVNIKVCNIVIDPTILNIVIDSSIANNQVSNIVIDPTIVNIDPSIINIQVGNIAPFALSTTTSVILS